MSFCHFWKDEIIIEFVDCIVHISNNRYKRNVFWGSVILGLLSTQECQIRCTMGGAGEIAWR